MRELTELHDPPEVDAIRAGCLTAAEKLYKYLASNHVREDGAVVGPDPGARFNARIWRFVKSYMPFLPWNDLGLYRMQAQGYWTIANTALFHCQGEDSYRAAALTCADTILSRQTDEGYWVFDDPEWGGRIATVEGCFAGLGLLAAYRLSGDEKYLVGSRSWYRYMIDHVGFQTYDTDALSLNYWGNHESSMVPNNATLGLWFCAELGEVTGDSRFLEHAAEMLRFVVACQLPSGELPYALISNSVPKKTHYLCYQYHGYQFNDLAHYYRLTKDSQALDVLVGVGRFLAGGLTADGDARFACGRDRPLVHYYTAVVASALLTASRMGIGDYSGLAASAYRRLLTMQKPDGGFIYSVGDYGVLTDRRSYAKPMAMILQHLLTAVVGDNSGYAPPRQAATSNLAMDGASNGEDGGGGQ